MKKSLLLICGCLLAAFSMNAQTKGDMSIGGDFGFTAGGTVIRTSVSGEGNKTSSSSSTPNGTFTLAPRFNYFVIDNLALNTGLTYDLIGGDDWTNHNFTIGIGLNYYLSLTKNFYYTPGFYWDFGVNTASSSDAAYFTTGLNFDFGRFEVKLNQHHALTLGLISLDYDFVGKTKRDGDVKISKGVNTVTFGVQSKIGYKYYF